MTPEQIDAAEAFWCQQYANAIDRVLAGWKRDMKAAGKTPDEITAALERDRDEIVASIRKRMASIRPLILSAHYGFGIEELTHG